MRACAFIFVVSLSLWSQTHGFRSDLVQSNSPGQNGAGTASYVYLDNVTSGDLLVFCHNWNVGGQSPTVSDTQTNTWTAGTQVSANDGSGISVVQCWWTSAGSTGADTVTISSLTVRSGTIAEFSNMSATRDVEAQATTTTNAHSLTTTPTTTLNGDLCVSFAGQWSATSNIYPGASGNVAGGNGSNVAHTMRYDVAGVAGAQSFTLNENQFLQPPGWAMVTECFQPAAISIVTSALPHGAETTAYKACLLSQGGAGALTWSALSGLPGWATLNASTGCITGTPNAIGTSTVNFQVTDGTHTTTRSLTLGTGASFATPTLVQHKAFVAANTNAYSSNVTGGNLLIVNVWGREAGGSATWYPEFTGANNVLSDTRGTAWQRIYPIVGVPGNNSSANGAPILTFAGCAPSSGPDTVSYTVNLNNGTGTAQGNTSLEEWSGAQIVIDDGAGGTIAGAAGSTLSVSATLTTQVANEVVHLLGTEGVTQAPVVNAPFSTIDSNVSASLDLASGQETAATAGNYTGTLANGITGSSNTDVMAVELFGLRPDITGLVCGGSPVASSTVRHRAVMY